MDGQQNGYSHANITVQSSRAEDKFFSVQRIETKENEDRLLRLPSDIISINIYIINIY